MVDNLSPEKRKKVMSSIRSKDTRPELLLWEKVDHRSLRRHPKIPGNPDIGNKSRKIAVFVDGCFWHGCPACYKAPATRPEYWEKKLLRNTNHDSLVTSSLGYKGYAVMRFWEHEVIKDGVRCAEKVMEVTRSRGK